MRLAQGLIEWAPSDSTNHGALQTVDSHIPVSAGESSWHVDQGGLYICLHSPAPHTAPVEFVLTRWDSEAPDTGAHIPSMMPGAHLTSPPIPAQRCWISIELRDHLLNQMNLAYGAPYPEKPQPPSCFEALTTWIKQLCRR